MIRIWLNKHSYLIFNKQPLRQPYCAFFYRFVIQKKTTNSVYCYYDLIWCAIKPQMYASYTQIWCRKWFTALLFRWEARVTKSNIHTHAWLLYYIFSVGLYTVYLYFPYFHFALQKSHRFPLWSINSVAANT